MQLTDKVEIMRKMLNDAVMSSDADFILKVSQDLDELIVEYYRENNKFQ